MSTPRIVCIVVALCALALGGACSAPTDPLDRAAEIERQLLLSCSCHPKKIAGLPLETSIRSAIAAGIAAGGSDQEILWEVLTQYGTALLEAGTEDVEVRAQVAAATSIAAVLLGLGVLLLQLRRD